MSVGLIPEYVLDVLWIIAARYPDFYYDEFAAGLFQITHFPLTKDQVRTLFYKNGFVYNIINELRPFLQDPALFKYWREHVIYEGGPITARMLAWLGYIEETDEICGGSVLTRDVVSK